MNQYETVFILTPVLSDEQMKETAAKFKKVLIYCLVEFKAEPEVIKTLETAFRRDEKVIRFQTVKLDKYAVEYAEKRRNKLGAKTEEA